jgi:hypothetical protein
MRSSLGNVKGVAALTEAPASIPMSRPHKGFLLILISPLLSIAGSRVRGRVESRTSDNLRSSDVAAINGFDPQPHIFLRDINILILSRKRASYAAGKCVPQAIECPALGQHVRELPVELGRSLTWDRGTEMARHKDFTLATDMQVFFCDPHSPWQRGTNENTNGLLRQYLPKGEDLSEYSQQRLNEIAMRLNQRPRQTLGFSTPAEVLSSSVALTG